MLAGRGRWVHRWIVRRRSNYDQHWLRWWIVRGGALGICVAVLIGGCALWVTPTMRDGRSDAPERELLVLNNLSQTVSSVLLAENGAFIDVDHDITQVGAVPGGLVAAGQEIVITLSGENRLIFLDRDRLVLSDSDIVLSPNTNPMQTVFLGAGVFATTGLFSGRVHLSRRDGTALAVPGVAEETLRVGTAPQALIRLAGMPDTEPRIVAAATGFDTSRPSATPFGKSSVVLFSLERTGSLDPVITTVKREATWQDDRDGRNVTALLDVAAVDETVDEILLIGSGINMGAGGTGKDDGTILVLHRDTLAVLQDISVGGSPGGGVVVARNDGGLTLFLAGVEGITSLQRPPGATMWDVHSSVQEYDASAGGGLPLLAGMAVWNGSLYVADFGNDRILRFEMEENPGWRLGAEPDESITVSDGPQSLAIITRGFP